MALWLAVWVSIISLRHCYSHICLLYLLLLTFIPPYSPYKGGQGPWSLLSDIICQPVHHHSKQNRPQNWWFSLLPPSWCCPWCLDSTTNFPCHLSTYLRSHLLASFPHYPQLFFPSLLLVPLYPRASLSWTLNFINPAFTRFLIPPATPRTPFQSLHLPCFKILLSIWHPTCGAEARTTFRVTPFHL